MEVYVSELYLKGYTMFGSAFEEYAGCGVYGTLHDIVQMLKVVNPPSERKHRSISKWDKYIVIETDNEVLHISRKEVNTGL